MFRAGNSAFVSDRSLAYSSTWALIYIPAVWIKSMGLHSAGNKSDCPLPTLREMITDNVEDDISRLPNAVYLWMKGDIFV